MVGIAGLFVREPIQWGLRGDLWLWRALAERLRHEPLPDTRGALDATLRMAIAREVGRPLTSPHDDSVFVPRFAHGGMSSGVVSLPWWRDTGLPKLLRRAGLPGETVGLRATCEDDWQAVRALRLRNAADNPISYGATLAVTEAMTEDDWRVRARRGTATDASSVVALDRRGRWVGMMGAQEHAADGDGDGDGALLTGVYVEPSHRGRRAGVADALIGEVLAWASLHAEVLRLWVDAGPEGAPARAFYTRQGFRPTGRRQPLGGGFTGEQVEMALAL